MRIALKKTNCTGKYVSPEDRNARILPPVWSAGILPAHSARNHEKPSKHISQNAAHGVVSLCLAATLSLACGALHAASDKLVLLNGQKLSVEIQGIDEAERVTVKGRKDPLPLQGLRLIARAIKTIPAKDSLLVHLIDGSSIRAYTVTAVEDQIYVTWAHGKKWKLPFDVVRGIRLVRPEKGKPVEPSDKFLQGLKEEGKEDVLYAGSGHKIQAISGGLQSIDSERVTFVWNDTARKISLGKVYGITFATTLAAPEQVGRCLVILQDGSKLWGRAGGLAKGTLKLKLVGDLELALPWKAVTRLEVASDRLVFLSDLEPSKVQQKALVTFAGPWRADKSVLGNPLMLGKDEFEKGLGVHAHCQLTYPCSGKFDVFAATIGIDAETKGKGDCIFKIMGGGKELFKKRVRGSDQPTPVKVRINGLDEITLAVEPGEDLDLADHANWCDARFLKE